MHTEDGGIVALADQVMAAAVDESNNHSAQTHASLLKKINSLKRAVETPVETVLNIAYQVSILYPLYIVIALGI